MLSCDINFSNLDKIEIKNKIIQMKNLKYINRLQIASIVLISIGSLVIFPENDAWYHDILQKILAIGIVLNGFLQVYRYRKTMNTRGKALMGLMLLFSTITISAQDYSKQIAAFTKSFAEKDASYVSAHTSKELQFFNSKKYCHQFAKAQ